MDRCHCRHNRGLILHTLAPARGFVRHHRGHHEAIDVPAVRAENVGGVGLPRRIGHIETGRRRNLGSAAVSAAVALVVGRDDCAFPSLTSLIGKALETWSYCRHYHRGFPRFY